MSEQTPDVIVKTVILKAPLERVWKAISDSAEFGSWFGMTLDGPFVAHTPITGVISPTIVNAEVAAMQAPHKGTPVEFIVADIEPMRLFSFRWHPFAIEKGRDYSAEPMTLVTFELEPAGDDVRLTITESGFHAIPLERRAQAFAADEGGWTWQARLIEAWLAR